MLSAIERMTKMEGGTVKAVVGYTSIYLSRLQIEISNC
jgi:hypothetical protein